MPNPLQTRWRFIDAGRMEAPVSFGRMPTLAGGVAMGGPQILMTAAWARAHFQIGWFDDVDNVLDLDAAREAGIDVFRRPVWGGGAAFYDTEATALFSWFIHMSRFESLDEASQRDEAMLGHLLRVAARIANDEGLADGGYRTVINTGAGAGQSVFHLHVHVIPRHQGVPMKPPASVKEAPEILADQAKKLTAALAG